MEEQIRPETITDFMLEEKGSNGLFAVFSEDECAGYFFAYRPEDKSVLAQVRIYEGSRDFSVQPQDVEMMWSSDWTKCGVVVFGQMRGVINVATGLEISKPLRNRYSPGIIDPEWLQGFDTYLNSALFMKGRQQYWKKMVKHEPDVQPLGEDETPVETNFVLSAEGPGQLFCVFEDDGETGYLYLYDATKREVLRHLHIYDRSPLLEVAPGDVRVLWSTDSQKCGVVIWGKFRGIIDVSGGREGRAWMESRDTPGIGDADWLRGF